MAASNTGAEDVAESGSNDSDSAVGDGEFEVEYIIDMKGKGKAAKYLVHWKNYGSNEDSWEPASNLAGAKGKVNDFLKKRGKSASATPSGDNKKKASKASSSTSASAKKAGNKRTRKSESVVDVGDEDEAEDDDGGGGKKKARKGGSDDDSVGEEDDDEFSPSSAKKKKSDKKSSKRGANASSSSAVGGTSAGRTSMSSTRHPAPHSVDSLTMAVNRRRNYGNHSSWLESDEDDSDNGAAKKEKAEKLADGGAGGDEKTQAEENGDGTTGDGEEQSNGGSTPTTVKMNGDNAESRPLDPDDNNKMLDKDNNDKDANEPSEHDPPPLDAISNFPSLRMTTNPKTNSAGLMPRFDGTSISSHSARASNSKERSSSKAREEPPPSKKGDKAKEQDKTGKEHDYWQREASKETVEAGALEFDGVYLAKDGTYRFVASRPNGEVVALTYEEARRQDMPRLCDYFFSKFQFDAKGNAAIATASPSAKQHQQEQSSSSATAVALVGKSLLREDGKLAFDE